MSEREQAKNLKTLSGHAFDDLRIHDEMKKFDENSCFPFLSPRCPYFNASKFEVNGGNVICSITIFPAARDPRNSAELMVRSYSGNRLRVTLLNI